MSSYLIECCLRASANVSYENAAQDIERYTGIKVSGKTQQRVENLYKVGGSLKRITQGKQLLWRGKVNETLSLFSTLKKKAAYNFCTYLRNHQDRIVDYEHFQTKGICAIASGAVESTVKQIDRRLKISGAQWKVENVPQVLRHRCAYLNNSLFAS